MNETFCTPSNIQRREKKILFESIHKHIHFGNGQSTSNNADAAHINTV